MKRRLAEEKYSFESPTMTPYLWSFDIFCITLTVFELFAENRFDGYRDARHLAEKIFSFESQTSTSY
jgi:hypothetical protein